MGAITAAKCPGNAFRQCRCVALGKIPRAIGQQVADQLLFATSARLGLPEGRVHRAGCARAQPFVSLIQYGRRSDSA